MAPVMKAWSLNHWTAREVLLLLILKVICLFLHPLCLSAVNSYFISCCVLSIYSFEFWFKMWKICIKAVTDLFWNITLQFYVLWIFFFPLVRVFISWSIWTWNVFVLTVAFKISVVCSIYSFLGSALQLLCVRLVQM